ncbi:MAG: class I SAM-dependent methyltransferase [Acidobacteriota bacterium]
MMKIYATKRREDFHSRWMERIYSTYSDYYDLIFDRILKQGREEGVRALEIREGDRILEVGIGTGLSIPLYPNDCFLFGIDISEEMLRKAREKIIKSKKLMNISLKKMDASALSFEDCSFDKVLVPYLISVVPDPDRVVLEINRVCKPGGIVVFVNHFHSSNPFMAMFEKTLSPVSRYLGFRLDLPVESVLERDFFEIERMERVNLFGLWNLIKLRKKMDQ